MHYAIKVSNILLCKQKQTAFSPSSNVILKVLSFSGAISKGTVSIFVNFLEESLVKCHLLSSSHLEYSKILLFQAATIKTAEDYIVLSGCSTSNTVRTVSHLVMRSMLFLYLSSIHH